MFPTITIFGKTMTTYALIAVAAMLLCGALLCRLVKKRGRDSNDAIIFLLIVAGGILIGGHILYGITNISRFGMLSECESFSEVLQTLGVLFGGMVFYGGLIGGAAAGLLAVKFMHLDLPVYADAMAVAIPLFHGFARIGCFLGGCCYGIESSFGFTAHGNTLVPDLNDVSRFPVQLLESFCNFLIFFAVFWLYRKKKLQGRLIFVYLGIYAVVRFFDEFLRGDAIRGFIFGMSTSQFISIWMALIAIVGMFVVTKRFRTRDAAPVTEE